MTELNKLIGDLQNYIHFLDHLIKTEPFQEHHKNPQSFKRLKKMVTASIKYDKEIHPKKTYS